MRLPNWTRLSRKPDEVIGQHEMLRWHLIPPTSRFAIYLHKHRANDPRTHHDHPADNISIRIRGQVVEYVPDFPIYPAIVRDVRHGSRCVFFNGRGETIERARMLPRFRFRRAEDPHRLELPFPAATAWTIWIRFRNRRTWGFFHLSGWRPAPSQLRKAAAADDSRPAA